MSLNLSLFSIPLIKRCPPNISEDAQKAFENINKKQLKILGEYEFKSN